MAWRFDAVPRSTLSFPLGVKTVYRAFASDDVYEIVEDQSNPLGWSPRRTICTWQPAIDHSLGIAIEGMYVLQRLPFKALVPADFSPEHLKLFHAVIELVKSGSYFGNEDGQACVIEWMEFAQIYPQTVDCVEYVTQFPSQFVIPLREELFGYLPVVSYFGDAMQVAANRRFQSVSSSSNNNNDIEDEPDFNVTSRPETMNMLHQTSTPSLQWSQRSELRGVVAMQQQATVVPSYIPPRLLLDSAVHPGNVLINLPPTGLATQCLESFRHPLQNYDVCTIVI